ncbi:MAG: hypothetical protein NC328_05520 [Muribaculum sp.]|nr:hypothetical protein [Muribaculum sp.]
MNILILGFSKMKLMPYASFYLDNINLDRHRVDFVYWNRDLLQEDLMGYDARISFYEYRREMEDMIAPAKKLRHFYGYRRFVMKLLKKKDYDFVICLHTMPGLLMADKLLRHYKGRYIFDYRDSTFETISLFGSLVRRYAAGARTVFVSSDGFRRFLPDDQAETITSHNLHLDSLAHREDRQTGYVPSDKIRISFWGLLRHPEHNIKIINRIGDDERFELHYYGREFADALAMKEYVRQQGYANIFFHGEYKPEERYEFAKSTDLIHNSYDDANMRLAMSNKYYDGLIFRIPQICMAGGFMGERCLQQGVGFALNPDDPEYADKIYESYRKLDREKFYTDCDRELSAVLKEYNLGRERLRDMFG